MTIMACGVVACSNSKAPTTEQGEAKITETVQKDDTTAVDTAGIVTRGSSESEGFGRCAESGCYCKKFKGRGNTCANCGHAYKQHY